MQGEGEKNPGSDVVHGNRDLSSVQKGENTISVAEIEAFFKFFRSDLFGGWIADERGDDPVPVHGFVYGTAPELIELVTRTYTTPGSACLHVCLNELNGRGRRTNDVVGVRVFCVDLDDPVEASVIAAYVRNFGVGMVVASSPGRFHLYWKCDEGMPLEVWARYQRGLAFAFGGDENFGSAAKTIRVPGILRVTKDGTEFVPYIAYVADETRELSDKKDAKIQVTDVFPQIHEWCDEAEKVRKKRRSKIERAVKDGLTGKAVERTFADMGDGSGRNVALYEAIEGWVEAQGPAVSLEHAQAQGDAINRLFRVPLEGREVTKTVRSAYETALERLEWKAGVIAEKERELDAALKSAVVAGSHQNGSQNGVTKEGNGVTSVEHEFKYDYTDPILSRNRFTDLAVAARVLQRFGDRMVAVGRQFFAFNAESKTWIPQESEAHRELYGFYEAAVTDTLNDPEFVQKMCLSQRGEFSNAAKVRAEERFSSLRLHSVTVRAVRNSPRVKKVSYDAFDAEPHMLLVGNGLLDTSTGQVREPTTRDYALRRTPVRWNPEASTIWWEQYVMEVFARNKEPAKMSLFMQEIFGYSLSTLQDEQKIFCHYGDGCNGKSKILMALGEISGEYGTILDPEDLVRAKNALYSRAFERVGAKLEYRRVVTVDDVPPKSVWNEGTVKNLTGPFIRARAENEKSRVVPNRSTIHVGFNASPAPEQETTGIFRRMCLIPYGRQFEENSAKNKEIEANIRKHAEGILVWSVRGFQRYLSQGKIIIPEEIARMASEYKEEHFVFESTIRALFEAPTEREGGFEFLSTLTDDVNTYLRQNGEFRTAAPQEVGQAIRRVLNVSIEKQWCAERKNAFRGCKVKLKFVRQNNYVAGL